MSNSIQKIHNSLLCQLNSKNKCIPIIKTVITEFISGIYVYSSLYRINMINKQFYKCHPKKLTVLAQRRAPLWSIRVVQLLSSFVRMGCLLIRIRCQLCSTHLEERGVVWKQKCYCCNKHTVTMCLFPSVDEHESTVNI